VTAEDFTSFALEAGGVKNATAIANAHPNFPSVDVPGAVTVIIVPDTGETPPMPSRELIASVCSKLEPRRLITTEVYVKAPDYKAIRVEAFVEAAARAAFDAVSDNVKKALNRLLDPKVWTFGEDLQPTRIYKAILDADKDVVSIKNLNIYVDGRLHQGLGQVVLGKTELVYGRDDHLIIVTPAMNR
jgi:hypothetical protein